MLCVTRQCANLECVVIAGEYDEYPSGSSNGTTYRHYVGPAADFEFGFGLSFTTFRYTGLLLPETAGPCDDVNVSVRVTNTGKVTSDEVVQVSTLPSEDEIDTVYRVFRG